MCVDICSRCPVSGTKRRKESTLGAPLRVLVTFPSGEYKGVKALDADVCRGEIYPLRVPARLVPQVYLRLRVGSRILDPKASKDGGSSWHPRKV